MTRALLIVALLCATALGQDYTLPVDTEPMVPLSCDTIDYGWYEHADTVKWNYYTISKKNDSLFAALWFNNVLTPKNQTEVHACYAFAIDIGCDDLFAALHAWRHLTGIGMNWERFVWPNKDEVTFWYECTDTACQWREVRP